MPMPATQREALRTAAARRLFLRQSSGVGLGAAALALLEGRGRAAAHDAGRPAPAPSIRRCRGCRTTPRGPRR